MALDNEKYYSFNLPDRDYIEFRLRTRFDKITEKSFIRSIIKAYIEKDEDFMNFFYKFLPKVKKISKAQLKRIEKSKIEEEKLNKFLQLTENEIEDVYDLIEQENLEEL